MYDVSQSDQMKDGGKSSTHWQITNTCGT